jgi:hypothetical protein
MKGIKVTALKDVHILVNIPGKALEEMDEGAVRERPSNTISMIHLQKGKSRSDISGFLGIDARYLPSEPSTNIWGHSLVLCPCPGMERQEFHGLIRTEPAK